MEELLPITDDTAKKYAEPSAKALYARIARGQIPCCRIGRRVYLRPSDMARFLAAHTIEASEAPDPKGKGRAA